MSDRQAKNGRLDGQSRRLLLLRIPLVVALLVNGFLIAQVPLQAFQAGDQPAVAAADPQGPQPTDQPGPVSDEQPDQTPDGPDPEPGQDAAGSPEPSQAPVSDERPRAEWSDDQQQQFFDWGAQLGANISQSHQQFSGWSQSLTERAQGLLRARPESQTPVPGSDVEVEPAVADVPPPTTPKGTSQSTPDDPQPIVDSTVESELVLSNPARTGGTIHFLLDDEVVTLTSGKTHQVDGSRHYIIRFHRGAALGTAEYSLRSGRYEFDVTESGWTLLPVDSKSAQ